MVVNIPLTKSEIERFEWRSANGDRSGGSRGAR